MSWFEPLVEELREISGSRELRLERLWPFRDDGLLACFGDGTGWKRAWAVLVAGLEDLPKVVEQSFARGHGLRLSSQPAAVAFPARRDPELPALRHVLGGRLPEELCDQLPAKTSAKVRLLRYKPLRRAMLRLRLDTGAGRSTFYLKLLRRRDQTAAAAAYEALSQETESLRLAVPCARLDGCGGLLWHGLPGSDLALAEGDALVQGLKALGRATARLHRRSVVLRRRHSRARELATVRRWIEGMEQMPFATSAEVGELRRTYEVVEERARQVPEGGLVPSHRDLHPGQCLLHAGDVTLLDLDTAALAERELDAGNLLAHLRLPPFRRRRGALARAVRAGYEEASPGALFSLRCDLYEATSCLRLACVYRFRPGEESVSRQLAADARELLRGNHDSRRAI